MHFFFALGSSCGTRSAARAVAACIGAPECSATQVLVERARRSSLTRPGRRQALVQQ